MQSPKEDVFAHNVKFLCDRAKISSAQLARRIGLAPSTLYRQLNPKTEDKDGKPLSREPPRTRTVVAVANHFGITPSALLEEELCADNLIRFTTNTAGPVRSEHILTSAPVPLVDAQEFFLVQSFICELQEPDLQNQNRSSGFKAEGWIPAPPFESIKNQNLFAIRISGDAMYPILSNNDIAYVEVSRSRDNQNKLQNFTAFQSKDLVLATGINNAGIFVRRVIVDEVNKKWLVKENDNWPGKKMIECGAVFGKIVAKATRFA